MPRVGTTPHVRRFATLEQVFVFDEGRPRVHRRRGRHVLAVNDPRRALLHSRRAHLMQNPIDRGDLGEL